MAAPLPREGFDDLVRRARILWLWALRFRVRRDLSAAETELGWLGWEQVDFFDETIAAEVEKVREFENTQATLVNASAELSERKAALDAGLVREKTAHDNTQAALAAERAPIAAQIQQAETSRRQKLEAVERFERAIAEVAALEKQLEARSLSFLGIPQPDIHTRIQAREVSDELGRIAHEKKLVQANKATAAQDAATQDTVIAGLRAELQRIDTAASAARDTLAAATRRHGGETRSLDRQRKKSDLRMSHLDRKKREPYRLIGACLADHGIAPLNQPAIFEKVIALRHRDRTLTDHLSSVRAACSAADPAHLAIFYLLFAAVLFTLIIVAAHFL